MAHPSIKDEIVRDCADSGYASIDQGNKKHGKRERIISNVETFLNKLKREGKDKRAGGLSSNTAGYVSKPPIGECEGHPAELPARELLEAASSLIPHSDAPEGEHRTELPAMERPEAASRVSSHSDAPEGVPDSHKYQFTAHPSNSSRPNRPSGSRIPHSYNTAEGPWINDPIHNNYGPPLGSATEYEVYGIERPPHYPQHTVHTPGRMASFSDNNQLANATHIVGLRTSGTTQATNQDVMALTRNWVLKENINYGSEDQVVGQMVWNNGRPRTFAGEYRGNRNEVNGGAMVVGADLQ